MGVNVPNREVGVFIIGAPKSATTSLKEYLASHSRFTVNEGRELTYFISDDEYSKGESGLWATYYSNSLDANKIALAKNVNMMYSEKALLRLKAHSPNVKLIMVLRNPVDRAHSAYWYARRRGWEDIQEFKEAAFSDSSRFKGDWVKEAGCAYLEHGLYAKYIEMVQGIFGVGALKVYLLEDLKIRPQEVCDEIFAWCGLEKKTVNLVGQKHNRVASVRSRALLNMTRLHPGFFKSSIFFLIPRRYINYIKRFIQKINEKPFEPPPLNDDFRLELSGYFSLSNVRLGDLIKREIPWK